MNSDLENLREVVNAVLCVAKAMVDDPDAVRVDVISQSDGTLLRVNAAPKDVAILVGKNGRMARCLRMIVGTMSKKCKHNFLIDIPVQRM